jgi:hypothetical protein
LWHNFSFAVLTTWASIEGIPFLTFNGYPYQGY